MKLQENYSLLELNTFGIDVKAKLYCEVHSTQDVTAIIKSAEFKQNNNLILGGGSNILFTKDFEGLVVKNNLKGIIIII